VADTFLITSRLLRIHCLTPADGKLIFVNDVSGVGCAHSELAKFVERRFRACVRRRINDTCVDRDSR
jgi:hypothetical protein